MIPPLTAFDAVVFDMDGTLFDSEGHYFRAYRHAMITLGGELEEADYFQRIAGKSEARIDALLLADLPPGSELAILRQAWQGEYTRLRDTHGVPFMAGAEALLDLCAEVELLLAVASAAPMWDIATNVGLTGIASRFAALASGEEVAETKPAPDVYLLAAERLGVDPTRCLAFEDTNAGATAAIRAGMHTVMVPYGCEPDPFVREHAKGIATSLTEIVEALRLRKEKF